MSDARLRELERGDDAGDLAARVRLITERLRVGAIAPEQVSLAAFAGDEAARLVAGAATPASVRGLNQWWLALAGHGAQAAARSFCAVAALITPPEHDPDLRRIMDWCACPCDVHSFMVESGRFGEHDRDPRRLLSAQLVARAALAARERVGPARLQCVHATVQSLAQHGITRPRVRAAIQAALVPWLLGDDDPLLGPRPETLTGPWTCALLARRGRQLDARAVQALLLAEHTIPELGLLDASWTSRLPVWPIRDRWTLTGDGPGGLKVETTPRVWIVRSFARWTAFVNDAELRRAHLPGVSALGRWIGATSIVWAPDDTDLAAAAREGADVEALAGRLTALRGPPATSRLEDERLPEGPDSWWFVPLLA